jgi:hypothetical protein
MKKKIAITLDRERFLRLDLNAMAEFEEVTGISLFTIGDKLQEARYLRALLFATLKSAGEKMTIEEVGAEITMTNMSYIGEKIQELMAISYGNQEDESDGKK